MDVFSAQKPLDSDSHDGQPYIVEGEHNNIIPCVLPENSLPLDNYSSVSSDLPAIYVPLTEVFSIQQSTEMETEDSISGHVTIDLQPDTVQFLSEQPGSVTFESAEYVVGENSGALHVQSAPTVVFANNIVLASQQLLGSQANPLLACQLDPGANSGCGDPVGLLQSGEEVFSSPLEQSPSLNQFPTIADLNFLMGKFQNPQNSNDDRKFSEMSFEKLLPQNSLILPSLQEAVTDLVESEVGGFSNPNFGISQSFQNSNDDKKNSEMSFEKLLPQNSLILPSLQVSLIDLVEPEMGGFSNPNFGNSVIQPGLLKENSNSCAIKGPVSTQQPNSTSQLQFQNHEQTPTSVKTYARAGAPPNTKRVVSGASPECGILIDRLQNFSLESYAWAIVNVVGKSSIAFIGLDPANDNAILIFMKTSEMAKILVNEGIWLRGTWLNVSHFQKPATKYIISGVMPFIPDSLLIEELSPYGFSVYEELRKVPAAMRSPQLKGSYCYRREIYLIKNSKDLVLPPVISVPFLGVNYPVEISTMGPKCFLCGSLSHTINKCDKPTLGDTNPVTHVPDNSIDFTEKPIQGENLSILLPEMVSELQISDTPQKQQQQQTKLQQQYQDQSGVHHQNQTNNQQLKNKSLMQPQKQNHRQFPDSDPKIHYSTEMHQQQHQMLNTQPSQQVLQTQQQQQIPVPDSQTKPINMLQVSCQQEVDGLCKGCKGRVSLLVESNKVLQQSSPHSLHLVDKSNHKANSTKDSFTQCVKTDFLTSMNQSKTTKSSKKKKKSGFQISLKGIKSTIKHPNTSSKVQVSSSGQVSSSLASKTIPSSARQVRSLKTPAPVHCSGNGNGNDGPKKFKKTNNLPMLDAKDGFLSTHREFAVTPLLKSQTNFSFGHPGSPVEEEEEDMDSHQIDLISTKGQEDGFLDESPLVGQTVKNPVSQAFRKLNQETDLQASSVIVNDWLDKSSTMKLLAKRKSVEKLLVLHPNLEEIVTVLLSSDAFCDQSSSKARRVRDLLLEIKAAKEGPKPPRLNKRRQTLVNSK